jgi:hypothetical protein
VAELPSRRGAGHEAPEELEELPDDAIVLLKSSPHNSAPYQSAPEHPLVEQLSPAVDDDDEIIELGNDAIVGEGRAAHRPQPRTPVLQSNASIVINARNLGDSLFPRGEKTIVVRDRRALEGVASRNPQPNLKQRRRERALYFSAGIIAALLGIGFVTWLRAGTKNSAESQRAEALVSGVETRPVRAAPSESPAQPRLDSTPRVSVDELPVADKHR